MEQFQAKRNRPFNPKFLFVAFFVVSLISCAAYNNEGPEGILHKAQGAARVVTAPFQYAGTMLSAAFADAGTNIENATADDATLQELRDQNAELRRMLAEAEEYRQESERLADLLNMSKSVHAETIAARVVGRSTEAYNQTITINVGDNEGIDTGQTVLGPNGVIGQVIATTPGTATVRLLTDQNSGVAVLIQSSRAEGIVKGSLEGVLYLENIDESVPVQIGDVVVTSGLGGSYARGLIVGMVIRVDEKSGESSRQIVISPNEQAGPLQEVLVVKTTTSGE